MATPVVIVQDKKSLSTLIAMIVGNFLRLLLSGWIVMLLLPYVTPWAPGYWQTIAGAGRGRHSGQDRRGYVGPALHEATVVIP